ncbi:MAG: hypothetical protein DRQ42_06430 [Gammaproteobacteria bacterium]|nr:MAG: hypothetical protein DRQ42_06430 [Gammaproteobacteria bacterium]
MTDVDSKVFATIEEAKLSLERERQAKKQVHIPKNVNELLQIWYDAGLKKHRQGTKTLKHDVAALRKFIRGKVFEHTDHAKYEIPQFTTDEFIKACEGFALVVNSPDYWPADKNTVRKTTIAEFFYNPRSPRLKSWFHYCLIRHPRLLQDDKNPDTTKAFIDIYTTQLGDGWAFDLAPKEVMHMQNGAALTEEFFERYKHMLVKHKDLADTPHKRASLVMAALRTKFSPKNKSIEPYHIANKFTYGKTLIEFLKIKMAGNVIPITSMYDFR